MSDALPSDRIFNVLFSADRRQSEGREALPASEEVFDLLPPQRDEFVKEDGERASMSSAAAWRRREG